MPTLNLQRKSDDGTVKAVTFTFSGIDESETGPRGTLLKFVAAMAKNDIPAATELLTEQSRQMPRSGGGPDGDMEVAFNESTTEGAFTIIPTAIKGDGQELTLPFHLIQEAGQWRVDMVTTMDKLMGGLMGMMEQAMGTMAEGMGKMMEGVGQAMSQAFEGMSAEPTPEEKDESNGDSAGRKRKELE